MIKKISKILVVFLVVLGISFSNVPFYVLSGMIEGYIKTANIVDRAWHLSQDDNVVDKFASYRNLASKIQVREALAAAQGDGIALYAKNTNDGVYARTFTAPSTVSGETNILTGFTDTIRYIELKASPTRDEMIAVVQAAISTTGSTMVVLKWNGASWTVPFCIRTGGGTIGGTSCTNATYISNANTVRRAVAIEYENTSGDATVLYSSGASGTNEMKYQTWNGSAWSGELNLDTARLTGVVTWIELVPKPASNEMTALIVDSVNRDLSALVWDGTSAWGTEPAALLEAEIEDIGVGTNPTVRPFDGAYESSSGDFLAAWGYSIAETEATEVRYVTRASGGAWGSVVTPTTWPEIATIVDMAGDPDSTSNYIVHASQDPAAGDNQCAVWSGTAWPATPANCDINAGAQIAGNQGFGVGFLKSNTTKRAIVVWPEAASASLNYYSSDPAGNTWATAAFAIAGATSAITTPVEVVQDPFNTNILMATVQKGTGIHMLKLSMDATPAFTWSNPLGAALGTSPTTGLYQPFSFAFNRLIPATTIISNFVAGEPADSTIAPAASGLVDSFGLQTSAGEDTVTAATITLAAGMGQYIQTVAITNDADTTTYCSAAPTDDSASLSTCGIPVTTANTQFKIKLTAIAHTSMPAPDGGAYAVTATVTGFTSGNSQSGTDSGSATLTIDNDSPAGTTGLAPTAGDTQVQLDWSNPGDGDYEQVYIYCKTSTLLSGEAPTEGADPATDPAACDATARLKSKGAASPQTITGLTNGTLYYFRVYGRDTNGNFTAYTATQEVSATPVASTVVTVNEIGTQTSPLTIPSAGNHIGGAFTMIRGTGTANVTSITITESGTVDALTNLNNIKLQYDLDAVTPYDCASVSYDVGDTQYGVTDTNGFSAADGTSAFTGSVAVSDVQAMCVYVVLDVLSGASDGQTMIVRITNPSTDVLVSAGTVSPATPQGAGTTNLEVPKITVNTEGSQQNMTIGTGDNNVGGAFTFTRNIGTANVTQIVISDLDGTVNANLNLSDVVVFYKQEASCSASIPVDATQFNAVGVAFDTAENATTTGTMAVGTSKICVYVRLDVGDNVTGGQTLQVEITDPSAEVTVSAGSVTPATAVAIAGVTTFNAVTFTSFGMPFFYNSANWGTDGAGVTFFFEVYMRQTTGTVYARLLNETDTAAVSGSTLATTSASFVRLRTAGLTMTNGKTYRAQFGKIGADAGETLGAKLVVNQNKTQTAEAEPTLVIDDFLNTLIDTNETNASNADENPSLLAQIRNIVFSQIREALASLGLFIENGIARLEKLTARTIIVDVAEIQEANIQKARIQNLEIEKKIQLVDQITGEIYCTWIEQGEWRKEKGECAETAPEVSTSELTSTSETTESAAVESPPPVIESPTTESSSAIESSSTETEQSTTETAATEPTATEPTATEPATTDSGSATEPEN